MDKTFAAIEKLKEVELELHRLKNALEMMNKAYESKREWKGLTDEQVKQIEMSASSTLSAIYLAEAQLKGKNT